MILDGILDIFLGVLIGSVLGTYIATEIAYRRTEKWLIKLMKDEKFRRNAIDFLKDVSERFRKEYLEPRLKEMVDRFKGELEIPGLEEFIGGGDAVTQDTQTD